MADVSVDFVLSPSLPPLDCSLCVYVHSNKFDGVPSFLSCFRFDGGVINFIVASPFLRLIDPMFDFPPMSFARVFFSLFRSKSILYIFLTPQFKHWQLDLLLSFCISGKREREGGDRAHG